MYKYKHIHKLALQGLMTDDPHQSLREIARMTEPPPRKQPKLTPDQLKRHLDGFSKSRVLEYDKDKRETIHTGNIWVHPTKGREYFKLMYLVSYLKQHDIHTTSAEVGLLLRQIGGGRELLQIDRESVSVGWINEYAY